MIIHDSQYESVKENPFLNFIDSYYLDQITSIFVEFNDDSKVMDVLKKCKHVKQLTFGKDCYDSHRTE